MGRRSAGKKAAGKKGAGKKTPSARKEDDAGRASGGAGAALDFERPIRELEEKIEELIRYSEKTQKADLTEQIEAMRRRLDDMVREIFAGLSPWERVQLARHPDRPTFDDLRAQILDDWIELRGDRAYADDPAIATGLCRIGQIPVLAVAHRKGKTTKERVQRNFGMPQPEGYRKALRKMKLAEKLGLPVVTFINTPGAYPGVGAEERGQAHAIAENLLEMARLKVPVVCVVCGEGGSGGALGIGVGDRVLMLENAYYSVISPEGCAAILWKTAARAPDAARILKITAEDLRRLGVVDRIVAEPAGGAHRDPRRAAKLVKAALVEALEELRSQPVDALLDARYQKLRAIGSWLERAPAAAVSVEAVSSVEAGAGDAGAHAEHPAEAEHTGADLVLTAAATDQPAGPRTLEGPSASAMAAVLRSAVSSSHRS